MVQAEEAVDLVAEVMEPMVEGMELVAEAIVRVVVDMVLVGTVLADTSVLKQGAQGGEEVEMSGIGGRNKEIKNNRLKLLSLSSNRRILRPREMSDKIRR